MPTQTSKCKNIIGVSMNDVNLAIIIGRLGQDPEIHSFQNSTFLTRMSIATTECWIDKSTGKKMEKTDWHRVVTQGIIARIAFQDLKKGDLVYVEGSLRSSSYTDQQGIQRSITEIFAKNIYQL